MDDGGEAIKFLLRNLHRYCTYHWNLISGAEKEFEQLQNDARLFKQFLNDTAKKRRTGNAFSELARQIRDVVREADDAVDLYVVHAEQRQRNGRVKNLVRGTSKLHGVAVEIARVRSQVEEVYGGKSRLEFVAMSAGDDGSDDEPVEAAPSLRKESIVGFEEEVEELKPYIINQQTPKLIVISITGTPGIGKTACAVMIYHNSEVESNFPTRIWAYVNRNTARDVFLSVSRQLGAAIDDDETTEEELAQQIKTRLETETFFMVLDDVLRTADWDKLTMALPADNGKGKVLLTSRSERVARYASRGGPTRKLRLRTRDESMSILKRKMGECPVELEPLVRSIAEQCGGLPVVIDVMGGILVTMCPTNERTNKWANVSKSVNVYLQNDPEKRVEKLIDRSYRSLPDHLRDCLRYFGLFPKGFKISAWNLIRMWIAEGFVPKNDGFSLEETAESCLEYLVDMNLVIADETSWDGRVKTVRVHDTILDFCKTKSGGDEGDNFLQEIKLGADGHLEPSPENIRDVRRICMHSNVLDLVSAKSFGPRVRSFVSCSTEEETVVLPKRSASAFLSASKLLRVLEAKPIKFQKIPKSMYSLVQLRYAHLSLGDVKVLHRSFSKLWNIQTLLLDTTSRTLEIKADIWKMLHLAHLKTNAIATLPKPGRTIRGGAKLQTLGTISPESCTDELFDRARNLNTLVVRGNLTRILNNRQNDSLLRAQKLENLTLIHDDVLEAARYNGPLRLLLPPTVRSLTLSGTFIDWRQMTVLGMLENLVELELKNNAFVGEKWETADGGFGNLQFLHIGETNLVTWEASAHHFPRLRRLELLSCGGVEAVPFEFAEIPSFQVLSLCGASQVAAISAERIRDAAKNVGFELIVHPPVD